MYSEGANFTYSELFHQMNEEEIAEANAALDIVAEQQKKEVDRVKRKK